MDFGAFLLPGFPLHPLGLRIGPEGLSFVAEPASESGCCPACGRRSRRIHSHYHRTLQDLPAHGRIVRIELHLPRFFCDQPDCPQVTFAQPLPQIALPHARKTDRLAQALLDTALATGGEAGARLARQLNMPASGDTLLRLLRRTPAPAIEQGPHVLGVDDWALRRGQVYGTILCDLERHRPVDLLPERSSEAFAQWLREHPDVQIISRDRGGDYAKGASLGAPDAVQVADRWHLLHNLTEALQRAVDRRQDLLGEVAKEVAAALAPAPPPTTASNDSSPSPSPVPSACSSRAQQQKQASRQRRLARYQQLQELRQQGLGLREIGRRLKMSRNTVQRFAGCEQFPERATPTARPQPIDAYVPYLKQRWAEGCDNVPQLYKEIQGQGFSGSVYMVRRQVRQWRRSAETHGVTGPRPLTPPRMVRPSARRIAWLALGHVKQPTEHDQAVLKLLYERWPELAETAELARQFAGLLRIHDADSLEAWVQLAWEPMILPEMRQFAEGLRQDWAAVVEAVRQPWSQGQTEGQINRLKLIKRQMYGRASFDLLRQRVLHKAVA